VDQEKMEEGHLVSCQNRTVASGSVSNGQDVATNEEKNSYDPTHKKSNPNPTHSTTTNNFPTFFLSIQIHDEFSFPYFLTPISSSLFSANLQCFYIFK